MKKPAFKKSSFLLALALGASLACTSLFAADASTPTDPDACYKEGKALAEQGKADEALQKYLWCYDHGTEVNPKFARTRDTRVLPLIASLGKKFPAAKEALVQRRDAVLKQVKNAAGSPADVERAQQLGYLDISMEKSALLVLESLEEITKGTAAYKAYVNVVQERLVEFKHYREAASAENVDEIIAMLEKTVRNLEKIGQSGKFDEKAAEKMKNNAIKAAGGVEMYAGLGDLKHAKQIAELLLELSDHPDVRKAIVERLRNAKAEDLAKKFEKKK